MLMSVKCPWCNEWRALPAYEAWLSCATPPRRVCQSCWDDSSSYKEGEFMHTLIKRAYKIMEKQS